jgi:hypothetical protein
MCRLDDLMMTDKAQAKWRAFPIEIKIALRIAFWQALSNPLYAAYYSGLDNKDSSKYIYTPKIQNRICDFLSGNI